MDRGLYIAMSGAKEILLAQSVNANNLANANTTAFRADLEQARSMPVFGPVHPTRAYAMTERPAVDFKPGSLVTTGRDLDVAVHGEGWIAVQGRDGEEAYTRAGDLHVTPEGLLVTGSGFPVLGDGGPISIPPAEKVEIGDDGTVSAIPTGEVATGLAAVGRIKLVNPPLDELDKFDQGLMRLKNGGAAEASAEVTLVSGALESSNVNSVGEMVSLIELARQFEMQIKMMKTMEDNGAASAQLMRMT
ncbi:MAG TPA: flagellar basal-body rod protein FlgF [Methylococcaceae bacterium]|nr:flagellar basal-body rod protein FlgF [Methylococcaceae bacterium]